MATYNLGRIGFRTCGEYNPETIYEKLDVVTYDGSSYAANETSTGIAPTDEENWTLLARGLSDETASIVNYRYSTEETPTGAIWINGRRIYRKVIECGEFTAGQTKTFPLGVPASELGELIDIRGMGTPGTGYADPIPYVETRLAYVIQVEVSKMTTTPTISVICGTSRVLKSAFLIVEYTKK